MSAELHPEDNQTVIRDETAVVDLYLEDGCRIIGRNHVEQVLAAKWFVDEFGKVKGRQQGTEVVIDPVRTTAGAVHVATQQEVVDGVDIDVGDKIRQFLKKTDDDR